MKKHKITILILVLASFGVSPVSAFAILGGGTSGVEGGGNTIAAQFVYIGKFAIGFLKHEGVLTLELANDVLERTSVYDVANVCGINLSSGAGTCLDAHFTAETSKIEFDRNRWNKKTCEEKFVIASHEYLRSAGLEDSNYQHSSTFFSGGPNGIYFREMTAICATLNSSTNKYRP